MMMHSVRNCLAMIFVFMALPGCLKGPVSWQRVTLNQTISSHDVSFIVAGQTNISKVVETLGAPNQMLPSKDGIVTRYYFTNGKYFRADFGWGLRFLIPFLAPDLILGGGGVGTDVFQVAYDKEWIVLDYAFAFHSQSSEFRLWPFKD
jgi:hypothetical protein